MTDLQRQAIESLVEYARSRNISNDSVYSILRVAKLYLLEESLWTAAASIDRLLRGFLQPRDATAVCNDYINPEVFEGRWHLKTWQSESANPPTSQETHEHLP